MTEERKFAILFAATILAARKLIDMDPNKPNMAKGFFVDRAIDDAVFILERIDARWPTIAEGFRRLHKRILQVLYKTKYSQCQCLISANRKLDFQCPATRLVRTQPPGWASGGLPLKMISEYRAGTTGCMLAEPLGQVGHSPQN
jgi:hypothetical protein